MATHRIRRSDGPDLELAGELLGEASSEEHARRVKVKRQGGDATIHRSGKRWLEIRIYRADSGRYVTEVVGRSSLVDEHDRRTVTICETAAEAFKAVQSPAGDGTTFLSVTAKQALDQAAQLDEGIAAVHVERI